MWEKIRGYLTFTRKERYGVLFLLLLIITFFILPYFFKHSPGDPDPETYNKIKSEIRTFESRIPDSLHEKNNHTDNRQKTLPTNAAYANAGYHSGMHMFYFDPNKIGEADWIQLGLHEHLAATIHHYLEKGGHFTKAEDLKKLYGLHDDDYNRLYPFVRIVPLKQKLSFKPVYKTNAYYPSVVTKNDSSFHAAVPGSVRTFGHSVKMFAEIDVNVSDSGEWSRLPGIGEKLASRIVHFREKLGGFYQTDQVAEVYGLPDTTFRKIKPYLRMQPVSLRQIDINTATKEILTSHPYIRWPLARSIVEYRLQHGSFHAVDELLQLAQMDAALFEKLKPYLTSDK